MLLETRALLIPEKGLLKSLSEFTGIGSLILDQNFTILHISREIKTLTKYEEHNLVGRNCLSLCAVKDREAFRLFLAELNHEGVSEGRTWSIEQKDGQYKSCEVKGMCLETSSGEPLYLVSITDAGFSEAPVQGWQHEAEACLNRENALYASEERYRDLFELCPDMIMVHWPAHESFLGEPLEVNQAACETLEYSREELLMADTPILPPDENRRMPEIRTTLSEKKKMVFPIHLVSKSGKVIRFEFHSRYLEIKGQSMILSVARVMSGTHAERDIRSLIELEFEKYEIWNEKEGLWRVDDDRELFADLAEVFFRAQIDTVDKMRQALDDKDYDTVTKLAHSFKGSAGNLSATRIQRLSEYIERSSRAHRDAELTALLPLLELETIRFREVMVQKGLLACPGQSE